VTTNIIIDRSKLSNKYLGFSTEELQDTANDVIRLGKEQKKAFDILSRVFLNAAEAESIGGNANLASDFFAKAATLKNVATAWGNISKVTEIANIYYEEGTASATYTAAQIAIVSSVGSAVGAVARRILLNASIASLATAETGPGAAIVFAGVVAIEIIAIAATKEVLNLVLDDFKVKLKTILSPSTGDVNIFVGQDIIIYSDDTRKYQQVNDVFAKTITFLGSDQSENIIIQGGTKAVVSAGDGNDVISTNGASLIVGGNIEIHAGKGEDTIVSGRGNLSIDGGADKDKVFYANSLTTEVALTVNDNKLKTTVTASLGSQTKEDTLINVEELYLANDSLISISDEVIQAGAGDEIKIFANGDSDTIDFVDVTTGIVMSVDDGKIVP